MSTNMRERDRDRNQERKVRVPLGVPRSKLSIPEGVIPDHYAKRWVCDRPGRIEQAQAAGFTFVDESYIKVGEDVEDGKDQASSHIRRLVGTHEDGRPMYSYLMKQPREYYEEDRKLYNEELDKTDDAIRRGAIGPDEGHKYIPESGISYETTNK